MYTNTLCFCIFLIFFSIFLYEKQNKPKLKRKKNKNKLNKVMHKTRLTQNNKAKHTSNANKNKKRREKKWQNHLESFSFHTLEEPFSLANPWSSGEGEELKPFKFERNMRKRSKRGWKLILISRRDHAIVLCSLDSLFSLILYCICLLFIELSLSIRDKKGEI